MLVILLLLSFIAVDAFLLSLAVVLLLSSLLLLVAGVTAIACVTAIVCVTAIACVTPVVYIQAVADIPVGAVVHLVTRGFLISGLRLSDCSVSDYQNIVNRIGQTIEYRIKASIFRTIGYQTQAA